MAYQLVWAPEAVRSFESIIAYLQKDFTDKETARFVNTVNRKLLLIQLNPRISRTTSKASQRRRLVIHRRTLLFFRIQERKKQVELLYFFDTRQAPGKFRP
jgi:plasmid stabilization system protein ParE